MFKTMHIRLTGPFCKCMSAKKPAKNAYEIFLPSGNRPLTIRCRSCNKQLQVPDKQLNGSVVYAKPKAKAASNKSSTKDGDWTAFLGSEFGDNLLASAKVTTKRVTRDSKGDPISETPAPEPEPEPKESEPQPEAPVDTRPAYMRHLDLDEQR